MKRISCIYLFVAMVLFLPTNVQAVSTYTIIDSALAISGYSGYYYWDTGGSSEYTASYNLTSSSSPLSGTVPYASSGASLSEVAAEYTSFMIPRDLLRVGVSGADASTDVLFKPNFIGDGTPITFVSTDWMYMANSYAIIDDLTEGKTMFHFGSGSDETLITSFPYSEWDPAHTYRLYMHASAGDIGDAGGVSMSHNMVFVPDPSTVPIPAAFWLLGSGLLGLIGIRRRYKK